MTKIVKQIKAKTAKNTAANENVRAEKSKTKQENRKKGNKNLTFSAKHKKASASAEKTYIAMSLLSEK
ncbi:MAG: hypothetical protein IJX55_10040 [Clostridia bacterium]|nr:hypothetical protein [Clostridia bacterium]